MVIVSHSICFLDGLADALLYMEAVESVESGPAEQLLRPPRNPRTLSFIEQAR